MRAMMIATGHRHWTLPVIIATSSWMIDRDNLKPNNTDTPRKPPTAAGGVFIAIGTIGGAIAGGAFFGQPSAGLLVGMGLGVAASILVVLLDS